MVKLYFLVGEEPLLCISVCISPLWYITGDLIVHNQASFTTTSNVFNVSDNGKFQASGYSVSLIASKFSVSGFPDTVSFLLLVVLTSFVFIRNGGLLQQYSSEIHSENIFDCRWKHDR